MTTKSPQPPPPAGLATDRRDALDSGRPCPVVGIGASAGGLEAFTQLLKHLPLDTGMAFVLIQHLDPDHESALAQILSRATTLPVGEIADDQIVQPNRVHVIPRDMTMTIVQGVLKLEPRQRARLPHRPIDTFLESLAQDQRDRAVGVILSGTATDGTLGLEAIKAEGGFTFAQDESAKHDSMPRSAVAAGCVDLVLPPAEIARELARMAKHPYLAGRSVDGSTRAEDDRAEATAHQHDDAPLPSGGAGSPLIAAPLARAEGGAAPETGGPPRGDEAGFKKILQLLRNHSGVDFSLYKSTTIQRRIGRRLVLNQKKSPDEYAAFLQGNPAELNALYSDVLISVTSFFRNPEMFDVLKLKVLPKLLAQPGDQPLRCWVLGCSTGQEAYSIAMAFVEVADDAHVSRRLQVFATDLNDALLDKARQGFYAKSLADDVSPQRLRRFFVEEDGGYRINKALRAMVVFARQNVIADPPFSRLDLISCRNLLIYLEPSLQQKALPTFHYALKPGGFLLLGASESVGRFTDLFETVDKKHKIYSKKLASGSGANLAVDGPRFTPAWPARSSLPPTPEPESPAASRPDLSAQREADRITVNLVAPPGVLVDAGLQIVQFRGATGAYFAPPAGKASFDVLKMVREELMLPLRAAINEAKLTNKAVRKEGVRFARDGQAALVDLEVIPLKGAPERGYLILFRRVDGGGAGEQSPDAEHSTAAANAPTVVDLDSIGRVAALDAELDETREYLRSVQEQHEATNEELQSANEEIQSANEELQSINEELETSKEELESGNEELTTVNEEMANRIVELNRVNSDLVNLQASSRLAVILLGRDLAVRRFTPQAESQFDLVATDIGRPIGHLRHKLSFVDAEDVPVDVERAALEVIATLREQEHEVRDRAGRWHSLRLRPYLTLDNRVDGAVLLLLDIDRIKATEQAVVDSRNHAERIVETVRESLLVLDAQLRVESANEAFFRVFRISPAEVVGKFIHEVGNGQWDIPALRDLLNEILATGNNIEAFRVDWPFERLGMRTMLLNARRIKSQRGENEGILLAIEDITQRVALERRAAQQAEELASESRRKDEFLAMLSHELRNPLAPMRSALHVLRVEESSGSEAPIRREARAVIERQMANLTRLVSDLLEVSRVVSGRVRLERTTVDLNQVLRHAIQTATPMIESHRHTIRVTGGAERAWVNVDPLRMEEVFVNLLNNSAKYTPDGGLIDVDCHSQGDHVVVRVRDNGIGIDSDILPHVFELFTQAGRSLDRSQGGLGIGLSLARKLVELHGGTVEAHSAGLGHGSEFTVCLSAVPAPVEEPLAAPSSVEPSHAKSLRVLVVDDNVDGCAMLAHIVGLKGHETLSAHTGPAALAAARSWHPDVILLDIGLPELDGYEVARRLRADPATRNVKLVAITGYGSEDDVQLAREAGFDDHLLKPVELSSVDRLLAGWSRAT